MQYVSIIHGIKNKRWRMFSYSTEIDSDERTDLFLQRGKDLGIHIDWEFGSTEANYYVWDG